MDSTSKEAFSKSEESVANLGDIQSFINDADKAHDVRKSLVLRKSNESNSFDKLFGPVPETPWRKDSRESTCRTVVMEPVPDFCRGI